MMSAQIILKSIASIALFVVAGLCEIGGGCLVWLWLRDGRGALPGAAGGLVLFLYGVVPTFQPAHFGRVYAAYGGVFVVLSLLWGWRFDGSVPDRLDWIGAGFCILGVATIMYAHDPEEVEISVSSLTP